MKKYFKRVAVIALVGVMITSMVGCGQKEEPVVSVVGGWNTSNGAKFTNEAQAAFDNVTQNITNVKYEPIAYMGSQVVAGINHCILCKATVEAENATPYYTLMYIYEDINGNAEILGFSNIDLGNWK